MHSPSHPRILLLVVALASLLYRGSGGLARSIPSQTVDLSGTVTDPIGDSMASARVPTPPDFVAGTIQVGNGNLVLTVSFAPGTLSRQTGVTVYLDTDENADTGTVAYYRDSRPIGADYVIRGLDPHDPAKASITHETAPNRSVFGGLVDVTFPSADQRRIVVPLTRLGNDDGRLKFKLECYQVVASAAAGQISTQTTVPYLDLMPNFGAPPGMVR